MFAIDPRRTDHALEFRHRPFGPHSPELQAVLNVPTSEAWRTRATTTRSRG